ncbi:MAG: oxygen-dependent coproporphyrinogen oxidase [Alphaproteobacteria bacterium]
MKLENHKVTAKAWFKSLRDDICLSFEDIESSQRSRNRTTKPGLFQRRTWERTDHTGAPGGGGEMSTMHGNVFEKVGVNISTVFGEFSPEFRSEIPGAKDNPKFWASGLSVVAHMCSPLVPAIHMNTRFICTSKTWFGGGIDLTPMYPDPEMEALFHKKLESCCHKHDQKYYKKFREECDKYFYLQHREEPRGAGGIFYDYLDTGDWNKDFAFTKDVGQTFLEVYPEIVRSRMERPWTEEQRQHQLVRRGRYVEFNLLYDRGTKFGLRTGGNVEAILMSMPPEVKWT